MKLITRSALVAAAMLAPVSMAAASSTITYTSNFGPTNTETTFTGSLQGFDSSLGTLSSVLITYTMGMDITGQITNNAPQVQNFKAKEDVDGPITFGGSYTGTADVDPGVSQTYTNVGAGASVAFGPFTAGTDSASTTIALSSLSTDLSSFVNALTYSITTSTTQFTQGGGGNQTFAVTTKASGAVSIAYTYDVAAVPEPASWAMMVGGFGMLGGALRRKRGVSAVTFG